MIGLRRKWKKLLIYFLKFYRAVDLGFSVAGATKTKGDRMIVKVVSTILESPGVKIHYLPKGPKIMIYTEDKAYMITITKMQVGLTNHKYFFNYFVTDQIAESLINLAVSKLEEQVKFLDSEMWRNEDQFLQEIYDNFRKNPAVANTTEDEVKKAFKDLIP